MSAQDAAASSLGPETRPQRSVVRALGKSRPAGQRGFTLLEVLVATAIMAIAVSGLLSSLATSMRTAGRLTDYDRATMLARQKMDALLVDEKAPRSAPFQGEWDPALTTGLPCGWQAIVRPWDVPPGAGVGTPVLDRVQLTVWWITNGQRRTFTLEGYRTGILTPQDLAGGPIPPQPQ